MFRFMYSDNAQMYIFIIKETISFPNDIINL